MEKKEEHAMQCYADINAVRKTQRSVEDIKRKVRTKDKQEEEPARPSKWLRLFCAEMLHFTCVTS
jgi:hypothetical protein